MNTIQQVFKYKQPFIGYLTGGDGGLNYGVESALALIEGGVDILEIGLPFSEPVADGPVIQRASHRALKDGATPHLLLEMAVRLRKFTRAPLILFSYYNPLLKGGLGYLEQLQSAGFDGVLIVDYPPLLEQSYMQKMQHVQLASVFITTPSTSQERLKELSERSESFLYYACQKGTTGIRQTLPTDFENQLKRIRSHSSVPIAAGFGIGDRKSAQQALQCADGFVVGSAFVRLMENQADPSQLKACAQSIDPRQQEV